MKNSLKVTIIYLFLLGSCCFNILAMDAPEKRETATEVLICSICRGSFDNNNMPVYLCIDARHTTHEECIKKWQLRSSTCPECRRQLPLTMSQRLQRMFPYDEEVPPDWDAIRVMTAHLLVVSALGLWNYYSENQQKP